ncbi:MAG: hypothetical protein E3J72_19925 [Planctomycetota bacterium]|nr:MAG: hypothetical protein E3J72_19925 [Planctomycetota bacterium]
MRGRGGGRRLLSARRGGTRAGRGTTKSLLGRKKERDSTRLPAIVRAGESKGDSEYFSVRSAREYDRSSMDYRDTFVEYQRRAEDTLYRETVPLGYREYIRQYFENIRPPEEGETKEK